jgi:CHASE3 domain sensor protein
LTGTAKVRAGFGAGFALLLGICLAAILQTLQWEESARAVARTNQVIDRLEEVSLESKDAEDAARRFTATSDRRDLARCREALSQAQEREGELENLAADSSTQRSNMITVRRLIHRQVDTIQRGISASGDQEGVRQALASLDGEGLSSDWNPKSAACCAHEPCGRNGRSR